MFITKKQHISEVVVNYADSNYTLQITESITSLSACHNIIVSV